MFKLTSLTLTSIVALIFGSNDNVQATVLNNSFETGDFQSWSTAGQVTVEGADFGVTPLDGDYQAILETQDTINFSGFDLETFLGLEVGSLTSQGVTEGSAIKQTFTLNAGDRIRFSWNFLTDQDPDETDYNDFSFLVFNGLTQLADTPDATDVNFFTRLSQETGYKTTSIIVQAAGTYTLGFGVVDIDLTGNEDTAVNSALLIDEVIVTAVPEPLTFLGVATASLFGACFKRKLW